MTSDIENSEILLFRKWDSQQIEINDSGLKNTISLTRMVIPHSMGRHEHQKFQKSEVNIVERLVNNIMHFGRKHAKNTGRMGGKKSHALNIVETAFNIIQLKTDENPVQVLVRAIENTAPNEDTTRIAYGGVVYHVSVDIAPIRRVDLALRFITEGIRVAAFSTPRSIEETMVDELILASNNDNNSYAVKKKNEQERIAIASR
tara:strand:+ start:149 stop:757 length:609 start_codon:yes stop_codon:yes gene_type:complete